MGGDKENRCGWCGRKALSHGPCLFSLRGERGKAAWLPRLHKAPPRGTNHASGIEARRAKTTTRAWFTRARPDVQQELVAIYAK